MFANQHELEITTHDALKLRSVLTTPTSPRACVLLLSGGGNVGANGDVSSPFIGSGYKGQSAHLNEQLAIALLEAGVASLRYDKRGFADPGQLPTQTLPNLISDAKLALKTLRESVPNAPIVLVGLSEGALVTADLAAHEDIAGALLLSPPTRPYLEVLRYQFVDWPLRILKPLDPDGKGCLTKAALYAADVPRLPLGDLNEPLAHFGISPPSLETTQLSFDSDDRISFEALTKLYETRFHQVSVLLQAPFMKALYESYLANPPFSELAQAIKPPTYVYFGGKDSQLAPEWMLEDMKLLPNLVSFARFNEYGHCFAPMQGSLGEIKTSGPLAADVIQKLIQDVGSILPRSRQRHG